jgi:hypothetical protein
MLTRIANGHQNEFRASVRRTVEGRDRNVIIKRDVPRFVGTAPDQRLHDGRVMTVRRHLDKLHVAIGSLSGGALTVAFHGATCVRECHPENLHFSSLIEWTDCPPLRGFEFANWFQPGDDWDPDQAAARLEVIALGYHIIHSSIEREYRFPEVRTMTVS